MPGWHLQMGMASPHQANARRDSLERAQPAVRTAALEVKMDRSTISSNALRALRACNGAAAPLGRALRAVGRAALPKGAPWRQPNAPQRVDARMQAQQK
mmetsp:Transcript_5286/g.14744  ORF Transcript_5286/g.14744 Transcript_5286/m.14744 type:complete len:99 (-) Transcript_5286:1460-1756(-)